MLDNVVQLNGDRDTRDMMSQAKFFEGYSRWDDKKGRYETWEESVDRVMDMHREFYQKKLAPELESEIEKATAAYKQKKFAGAQRALQFGGAQILKHHMRLYNCTSTYADRAEFFGELMYVLLCGAGAGVSIQKHHVAKLPKIQNRTKQAKIHQVTDDIEGWGKSFDVLLSSYFVGGGKHPEYEGRRVYFDTSPVRDKGSEISGGFLAPGPEPLRRALDKVEHLLQGLVLAGETELRPIHVYDISMFIADAVLSGGVRRSATIFLFSPDDQEMMEAKTGDWYLKNPQRARSNNSVVIVRDKADKDHFRVIVELIRQFGEPGFVFVESTEHCFNPCVEVGMYPQFDGKTGWQGCNLTEINGSILTSEEDFYQACEAASILGTLQAGYTNFKFLTDTTKKIFEREALLGVSITGWMNNPDLLFDETVLRRGARIVKETNARVAALIGINPAARTTCVKPAGNVSVLLKTASGIHGEHSPLYFRNVQLNSDTEVAKLIRQKNPYMAEKSVWSESGEDDVVSFPIIPPQNSVWRDQLYGVNLLEKVKMVQQTWVEEGTNFEQSVDTTLRHNVSNTVSVKDDQWKEVADYLFENRAYFTGVSLLSAVGDRAYNQAPNTEVLTHEEISKRYGRGSMFASGLIVDATRGFNNLWDACMIARSGSDFGDKEKADLRADWIRRFNKYAETYFDGNVERADHCLKSVHLLHRWCKIQQNLQDIDFVKELQEKQFKDADTMGAQACAGGACEI